jgi:salicylate hydroxylase
MTSNGLTGEIVKESGPSSQPLKYQNQRVRRTRLQRSLLNQVPPGIIQLQKKLASLEDLEEAGVRLKFEDGTETIADLVVGGDGIRSVVREHTFPNHTIKFTGRIIWRVLLPYSSISHIPDIAPATQWWHGPAGHGYFSLVDSPDEIALEEQMFELANHNVIDPATATGKQFSWGVPATNERVERHFTEYDPRLREALSKVEEGTWKEFSSFAGPRLGTLTKWGKVVLIGDASHPLTGRCPLIIFLISS